MDNYKNWVTLLYSDWYLLRAKFRNDSNFLVREIGQERGVEERNSVVEVSWEVEEGDGDRNPVCKYFEKKKDRESSSSLSFNKFQLATNKMLEYDMPRI